MLSNEDFARLAAENGLVDKPFEPFTYYDRDGDFIEYIAAPDSYYAERVDGVLTVYYSHQTKKLIGSQIKGVKRLLQRHPGLVIDVQDGRVGLSHIIRAAGWETEHAKGDVSVFIYRKVVKLAEDSNADVELGDCAIA